MNSSRVKVDPATIFDVFIELVLPQTSSEPQILWKYPDDYFEEKTLKHVVDFAFPCPLVSEAVQLFSFVLTNVEGVYTFGYCRYTPKSNSCLCFLSALSWSEFFYKFLNQIASLSNNPDGVKPVQKNEEVDLLLTAAYHQEVPSPGETFVVEIESGKYKIECKCPDESKLPRIPDNRHLTEYYNAVDEVNMIAIWVSMLCERRIVIVSSKLGRLTSCVLAANLLICPMHWQHIFIPVLPERLFDYLQAPMPFLIGVPSHNYHKALKKIDLTEIVVLNVDERTFHSPFNDVGSLPSEVSSVLKKNLRTSNHLLGDGVARSFLRALVVLIGGYREALQFRPGQSILFSPDSFLLSRPPHLRGFLAKMLELQIFRQFIEAKLDALNCGLDGCLRDEFEFECSKYSGKEYGTFRQQYNEWFGNMKKESGAFLKQIRTKVRLKGKEAMRDLRGMLNEFKDDDTTAAVKDDGGSKKVFAGNSPSFSNKLKHESSTGSLNKINNRPLANLLGDEFCQSSESIDRISHKSDSSIERRFLFKKSARPSPLGGTTSRNRRSSGSRISQATNKHVVPDSVLVGTGEERRRVSNVVASTSSASILDELCNAFAQPSPIDNDSVSIKNGVNTSDDFARLDSVIVATHNTQVRNSKSVDSLLARPVVESGSGRLAAPTVGDIERLLIDFGACGSSTTTTAESATVFDPLFWDEPAQQKQTQTRLSENALNGRPKNAQIRRWETFE